MKCRAILVAALMLSASPVFATPPNMVCSGGGENERVHFEIPLVTNHSSIYSSGIEPLATYPINLTIGGPDTHKNLEIYSEHMVAQWLLDGRVDLRFYMKELVGTDEFVSYDLIVRTARTGEVSEESGQDVHLGGYEFLIRAGNVSTGKVEILEEIKGVAVCS